MNKFLKFLIVLFMIIALIPNQKNYAQETDHITNVEHKDLNGWYKENDLWFYYENGAKLTETWRFINGYWYYFDYCGIMLNNGVFAINDSTGLSYYAFTANGEMVTGWYKYNGIWYFFHESGKAANGLTTVSGNTYYFDYDGRMMTYEAFIVDNRFIAVDGQGLVIQDITLTQKAGWISAGTNWYYYENGEIVKNDWREVNGYWYYLQADGIMISSYRDYYVNNGKDAYGFDADGRMITGWYDWDEGNSVWWAYYHSNGKMATGVTTIGYNKYVFDNYGNLLIKQTVMINGITYTTDINGKVINEERKADGWYQNETGWYLIKNGSMVVQDWAYVNGYWYYFDYQGIMYTGWLTYNDKQYYLDSEGRMVTGEHIIYGKLYQFDESGAYIGLGTNYPVELSSFGLKQHQDILTVSSDTQIPVEFTLSGVEDLPPNYELDEWVTIPYVLFKTETGNIVRGVCMDHQENGNYTMTLDDKIKYSYKNLELLMVRLVVSINTPGDDIFYSTHYSSYETVDELKAVLEASDNFEEEKNSFYSELYGYENSYKQLDMEKFTIQLTDYENVNNPYFTNIEIFQNGYDLEVDFSIPGEKDKKYYDLQLNFQNATDIFAVRGFDIELVEFDGNTSYYKAKKTLDKYYPEYNYGTYELVSYIPFDSVYETEIFVPENTPKNINQKIIWDSSLNIVDDLTENELLVKNILLRSTDYVYDKTSVDLYCEDNGEIYYIENNLYDENGDSINIYEGLDLSVKGVNRVTVPVTYQVTLSETRTIDKEIIIKVLDENELATVVNQPYEICVNYKDVSFTIIEETGELYPWVEVDLPALVTYDNLTYDIVYLSYELGNFVYDDSGIPYIYTTGRMGVPIEYNPYPNITLDYIIYMVDDNGNIVDKDGNIHIKYENREDAYFKINDEEIKVSTKKEDISSNLILSVEQQNLDYLLDCDYVAYDLSIITENLNFKLMNDIKVSINLPETFNSKASVYYLDASGNKIKIESQIEDSYVVFETDKLGTYFVMKEDYHEGWVQIDSNWYYYQKGAAVTEWNYVGNKWYYFNLDGIMATGWKKDNNKWYYLNDHMMTGWQLISNKWYYFESSGEMVSGWKLINGTWYYLNSDMTTGWQLIDNEWYYFNSNGAMVTGTQIIDNKIYKFASSGRWIG